MKKLALVLLLLFLVSLALTACKGGEAPLLSIDTPPETSTEAKEPLNIEVFDETPFTNLSPFNSYENPTNLPQTTA